MKPTLRNLLPSDGHVVPPSDMAVGVFPHKSNPTIAFIKSGDALFVLENATSEHIDVLNQVLEQAVRFGIRAGIDTIIQHGMQNGASKTQRRQS